MSKFKRNTCTFAGYGFNPDQILTVEIETVKY
jgi:hypothetical protein